MTVPQKSDPPPLCLYVFLSVCLSVFLSLSVCVCVCRLIGRSVNQSVGPPVRLSARPSVCPSVCLSVSVGRSVGRSVRPCIWVKVSVDVRVVKGFGECVLTAPFPQDTIRSWLRPPGTLDGTPVYGLAYQSRNLIALWVWIYCLVTFVIRPVPLVLFVAFRQRLPSAPPTPPHQLPSPHPNLHPHPAL